MKSTQPPNVCQDCNVVVSLVTKGGGVTQTKHLRTRMNLVKEIMDANRLNLVYLKPERMTDFLLNPWSGETHIIYLVDSRTWINLNSRSALYKVWNKKMAFKRR
jgi:hypothetical protein